MIKETVKQALQQLFPEAEPVTEETAEKESRQNGILETDYQACGYHLDIQLGPDQIPAASQILDDADFFLESITGVDWIKEDQMEVIYDFSRYDFDLCRVVIRARTSRQDPCVPTISKIFAGANWHERETHDFFGIKFKGHPYLVPLLLPEDADFHPLLKDFKP